MLPVAPMVKIKICGVTNVTDAVSAADLGADAVGLNFFKGSPRFLSMKKAAEIVSELPPFVDAVAVFVNEPIGSIKKMMAELGLRTCQWHGGDRKPTPAKGDFTLNDFREKFVQVAQMDRPGDMTDMTPGLGDLVPEGEDPDQAFNRIVAMIDAMTDEERDDPDSISPARYREIALASSCEPDDLRQFLLQFKQVQKLMQQMASMSMWQKLKLIAGFGKVGQFDSARASIDPSISRRGVHPLRVIPAFTVRDRQSLQAITDYLDVCARRDQPPAAILVDAHVPGSFGGTGQTLPWELLADFSPGVPLILAGGLTPDNVARAIRMVRPYAVDVASGVESSPGKKDAELMKRFIDEAHSAG